MGKKEDQLSSQEILIKKLQSENARLEAENLRLKNAMSDETPLTLKHINVDISKNSGVTNHSSPEEKIALFRSLFRGRSDVYPRRWISVDGTRSGYSPVFDTSKGFNIPKEQKVYLPLTDEIIHDHLTGKHVIGVYPMLKDETCLFLAADFDKKSWKNDCLAFLKACDSFGIQASLECSRSGNGGHIWIFFQSPVTSYLARRLGALLLTRAMEESPDMGLDSYDRLFPSQDTMPKGGFGNLIALPLQKEARDRHGSIFLDRNLEPYQDQWAYLSSIPRLSADVLKDIIERESSSGSLLGIKLGADERLNKPWELKPSEIFCSAPLIGQLPTSIKAIRSNKLFIEKEGLNPSLQNRIVRLAAFPNPQFYQAQAMKFSTFNIPRLVHRAESFPQHIALPRCCLGDLLTLCKAHNIELEIEDLRTVGKPLDVRFRGELRTEQKKASAKILRHEEGLICAATAFGKTVVAAHLIAKRQVNTLIIVHRKQLLEQWIERLTSFLDLPSGSIGRIGGGKNKPTGLIDVAIMQSLNRKGKVNDVVADYGHVIIDECHHLSATSFSQVLGEIKAKYILGLTATPERKDGHHPIIFMYCGGIRYRMSAMAQSKLRPFRYRVYAVATGTRFDPMAEKPPIHEIYQQLQHSEVRNRQIIGDVLKALEEKRSPLILTERTEHLKILSGLLEGKVDNLIVLRGGMGKKQHVKIDAQLKDTSEDESRVILATGRYIGEGFDDSRLDTLFLAMPISWKGTLQQYAGRLHRLHEGKEEVRIYDYVDHDSPMLKTMFSRRVKGYKTMGYEIQQDNESYLL
ncbi:MAG: superfamily II DNA or RNA helicase [Rubritalea sp.]|jgi:superfamily II DNA or RNA helicase